MRTTNSESTNGATARRARRARRSVAAICAAMMALGVMCTGMAGTDVGWSLEGSWTDACCCKVSCPCLFGSKPTEGFCQGASVVEIERGRYGDVTLDGVAVVVTYEVGKWSEIVVDERATEAEVAAVGALLPEVLPFLAKGPSPTVTTGPVSVGTDGDRVRYAAPGTSVALEVVRGANGEPITIHNLPAKGKPFPVAEDHTQYKSEHLRHESEERGFEWVGRNGFRASLDLAGTASRD